MIRLWRAFWQWRADIHFYRWLDTKNPAELDKYHDCLDIKFFRERLKYK